MKRFALIACIAGVLIPIGLNAQKVYKEGDMVILDMTVEAGMPAEAVTDKSKTYWYNTQLGEDEPKDNELTLIDGAKNDHNHPLNAKVYQKLEISKFDSGNKLWVEAFNYCKGIDDGIWRLPTQRELMMMYIFKPALQALLDPGFFHNSTYYWSSTEFDDTHTYSCSTVGNYTYGDKGINLNSRCVREITP